MADYIINPRSLSNRLSRSASPSGGNIEPASNAQQKLEPKKANVIAAHLATKKEASNNRSADNEFYNKEKLHRPQETVLQRSDEDGSRVSSLHKLEEGRRYAPSSTN